MVALLAQMSKEGSPPEGSAGLEFVFSVLRKHEEALDKVTRRLEDIADAISLVKEPTTRPKVEIETLSVERISDWKEFKERCSTASRVLYEIANTFSVKALMNNRVLKYDEVLMKSDLQFYNIAEKAEGKEVQKHSIKLACGLEFSMRRTESLSTEGEYTQGILVSVDLNKVREWLADQLSVESSKISSGRIVI